MGAGNEILAELRLVRAELADLKALLLRGGSSAPAAAGGAVATDADLDSQWGDEDVKKDPPRWTKGGGAPVAPCRMSACPPDFLEELASFKDWQAQKNDEKGTPEGKKYAGYDRKSAARARGWAARLRARGPAQQTEPEGWD